MRAVVGLGVGARRSSRRAWLLLAMVLAPCSAHAQADDEAEAYQALIDEAVVEFRDQRFAEARALLWRAHHLSPSARTWRGIGVASFELRDYAIAHRALSAALADERRPLTEEQRAEVEALLERTRRFLGAYRPVVRPPSAELFVGGQPAELEEDGRLLLPLGTHAVTARARGYRDASQTLLVQGGEDAELVLALEPDDAPPADPPPRSAAHARPPAPEAEAAPRATPERDAAIVLFVSGGVLGAGAIGLGAGLWPDRQAELDLCDAATARGDVCANRGQLATERDVVIATTVATASLAGAFLALGAIFASLDQGTTGGAALRCVPAGPGLTCHARF